MREPGRGRLARGARRSHRPDFNIGIATGPAGLLVVDLDYKPDGGVNGLAAWWALLDEVGAATDLTYCVATPGGGLHLYYLLAPGWYIGNSAGRLGPGIDTRAEGGYVVAPPSISSAGAYEFDTVAPAEPFPAPAWLIDRLKPRAPAWPAAMRAAAQPSEGNTPYGLAALDRELGTLAVAATGTRNDGLVRAAFSLGRLVGGGQLDPGHVTNQLLLVALRVGLSERGAVATIRSGFEAGLQSPRTPR